MGKRKEEYDRGYKDAEKDFLDENKVKLFKEGYKSGYRDGYQAAMHDIKKLKFLKVPEEIRDRMDEGAQPGWPPFWW